MTAPNTPAVISSIAHEINAEHRACEQAMYRTLAHAIRAGELLCEVKSRVLHGAWLPWLAENFEGSERIAQTYMKLYRERNRLNPQHASDLSIRGALRELAPPKEPPQEPVEPPKPDGTRKTTSDFDHWSDWRDYITKVHEDRTVYEAAAFWRERCLHRLADIDMALDWHKECRPRYRKPTPGAIKAERAWERKRRRIQAIRRYWNRQRLTVEDIVRPVDLGGASPREWGYLLHFLTGEESIKSLQTLRDEGVLRLMGGIADEEERREANAALHKARKRAAKKRPAKPREWR